MIIFDEIDKLLERIPDVFIAGGQPEDMIETAEQKLGVAFPESFRSYLLKYGNLSFGVNEFYGLTVSADFDNSTVPNFVWFTLRKREHLPSEWLVFRDVNGEQFICIDTSQTLLSGDNPVVIWDVIDQSPNVLKMSFAEYLKDSILDHIDEEAY